MAIGRITKLGKKFSDSKDEIIEEYISSEEHGNHIGEVVDAAISNMIFTMFC